MDKRREKERVKRILAQNTEKDFVRRILNPLDSPQIDLGGGSYATHKMAWAEATKPDGGSVYRVYPTILRDGNELRDYGNEAYEESMRRGEYIEFTNANDADWFSKNYKKMWAD